MVVRVGAVACEFVLVEECVCVSVRFPPVSYPTMEFQEDLSKGTRERKGGGMVRRLFGEQRTVDV